MSTRIEDDIRQNEMLTVREVATYLRVSRVTVWRWCQKGILPASRVGRNWRIRRDDLLNMLNRPQNNKMSDNSKTNATTSSNSKHAGAGQDSNPPTSDEE